MIKCIACEQYAPNESKGYCVKCKMLYNSHKKKWGKTREEFEEYIKFMRAYKK